MTDVVDTFDFGLASMECVDFTSSAVSLFLGIKLSKNQSFWISTLCMTLFAASRKRISFSPLASEVCFQNRVFVQIYFIHSCFILYSLKYFFSYCFFDEFPSLLSVSLILQLIMCMLDLSTFSLFVRILFVF